MSEGAAAHKRCLRFRERALKNPRVQHLLEAINGLGCRTGGFENFVECISKNQQPSVPMMGGFAPHTGKEVDYRPRIVMVEEHNLDQPTFDRTLTHELIHAFDQCRANVDWSNPMHLACSEIRASNLSGECEFVQEFNRGKLGFVKHHQACVRRRAALSVSIGHQATQNIADQAVEAAYDRCYHDLAPFEDKL